MESERLPTMIVTGASGFIGRHLIDAAKSRFRIYAMARRSRHEAGVDKHPNLRWVIIDLTDAQQLTRRIERIRSRGPVDFIVHLAGYYDFANIEHPAYEASNVVTTRHMLEAAKSLGLRRFVFASSVVVTDFLSADTVVTERSPADAEFPYARSKRSAEKLVREGAKDFPCSIVRLAAIFSDWCEYGPLFMLLSTWFSSTWRSRILAGRGNATVPYFHVSCAVRTLLAVIDLSPILKPFDLYLASPEVSLSQAELFTLGTRLYHGKTPSPIHLPKPVIAAGIAAGDLWGRLRGRRRFERPWMVSYIDKPLRVDPSYTRKALPIHLRRRMSLDRRLPFIVENLKSYPAEFRARNIRALTRVAVRPSLVVTSIMRAERARICRRIFEHICAPGSQSRFASYQRMEPDTLNWYVRLLYDLLISCVGSGERMPMLSHARYIASMRHREGFALGELQAALSATAEVVIASLLELGHPECSEEFLNDHVRLAMQLAIDEAADTYESRDLVRTIGNGGNSNDESRSGHHTTGQRGPASQNA